MTTSGTETERVCERRRNEIQQSKGMIYSCGSDRAMKYGSPKAVKIWKLLSLTPNLGCGYYVFVFISHNK
jgi:hypothetical protein